MTGYASPSDSHGHESRGVSAALATVMTTVGFFAIAVLGLGILSAVTDRDIISFPGLGPVPGVVGMIGAIVVFAGLTSLAVRMKQPRFRSVWTIAIMTGLGHLLTVGVAVLVNTGEFVDALSVMSGLVTGGASAVLTAVAAVAGWVAVALRRTRASRPRWPWENEAGQ